METHEFIASQSEVRVSWGPLELTVDIWSENNFVEESVLNLWGLGYVWVGSARTELQVVLDK